MSPRERRRAAAAVLATVSAVVAVVVWRSPPAALTGSGPSFWTFLTGLWGVLSALLLALVWLHRTARVGEGAFFAAALLVGGATATMTGVLASRAGGGPSVAAAIAWGGCCALYLMADVAARGAGPERART